MKWPPIESHASQDAGNIAIIQVKSWLIWPSYISLLPYYLGNKAMALYPI